MKTIQPQDLQKLQKDHPNLHIIDVRDPDEFLHKRIQSSHCIPLHELEKNIHLIPRDQDVYVICESGVRSKQAIQKLQYFGHNNCYQISGGLKKYIKTGGQVHKSSTPLPLMRQVQIIAGSLVLLGILLSFFVHPYFVFLSAFVGAGLLFAGISGFCAMGVLLSKMPWNTKSDTSCCIPTDLENKK